MSTTLSNRILEKYKTPNFIETGTYLGEGLEEAIKVGFNKYYSIELHHELYRNAVSKFMHNENIEIHQGNSPEVLKIILKTINSKITFWLDGHYSGPHTAKGDKISPLLEELDAIKTHNLNNHNILIDDIRYVHNGEYGITLSELFSKIKEINSDYEISFTDGIFKDDILVATVKDK